MIGNLKWWIDDDGFVCRGTGDDYDTIDFDDLPLADKESLVLLWNNRDKLVAHKTVEKDEVENTPKAISLLEYLRICQEIDS